MFKQVEIPGKGQGLVATAKLPVGTTIIEESPIIISTTELIDMKFTTEDDFDFSSNTEDVVTKFNQLTEEQKNQVLFLHDPGPNSFIGMKWNCSTFDNDME